MNEDPRIQVFRNLIFKSCFVKLAFSLSLLCTNVFFPLLLILIFFHCISQLKEDEHQHIINFLRIFFFFLNRSSEVIQLGEAGFHTSCLQTFLWQAARLNYATPETMQKTNWQAIKKIMKLQMPGIGLMDGNIY